MDRGRTKCEQDISPGNLGWRHDNKLHSLQFNFSCVSFLDQGANIDAYSVPTCASTFMALMSVLAHLFQNKFPHDVALTDRADKLRRLCSTLVLIMWT